MQLALNLDKQKIPNIIKINRVPGFEEVLLPDGTELIGIKYFLFTQKHNKIPIIIRLTSTNKSFSILYGIDFYDKKGNPEHGVQFKNNLPDKELLRLISFIPTSAEYTNENYIVENYLILLQEGSVSSAIKILKNAVKKGDILNKLKGILKRNPKISLDSARTMVIKDILQRNPELLTATVKDTLEKNPKIIADIMKDIIPDDITLDKATNQLTQHGKSMPMADQLKGLNLKDTIKTFLLNNPSTATAMILSGLPLLYAISMGFKYYFKKYTNWAEARRVAGPLEIEMNNKIFKGQKYNEPAYKMYFDLQNFIKFVALGKAPAIILCGPPGMSKTYIVKRTFYFEKLVPRKDYNIEKGSALSTVAIYDLLYANRNKILVLDDFDTPLRNEDTVNMLKAITDSYDKRILSFPSEVVVSKSDDNYLSNSPRKFEYKGKLIIITNLKKSEIDRALLSRAPAFEVNFKPQVILASIEKMIQFMNPSIPIEVKREVLDYMELLYHKQPSVSIDFRAFTNAVDARVGNPSYWKDMVRTIIGYEE